MKAIASFVAGLLCVSTFASFGQADCEPKEVVPDHLAALYRPKAIQPPTDASQNMWAGSRLWENGRKLRVCFFNANPVVSTLIRSVASEWNAYSGVDLDFGKDGEWLNCLSPTVGFTQIRIGFADRGYWSLVGTHSEQYGDEIAPSMNFDSFNRKYKEPKYTRENVVQQAAREDKSTILHEFGHALGLLHEHQNPNLHCFESMKREGEGNIYQKLGAAPHCWSRDQVDTNLGFIKRADPDYVAGKADPKSIMMYPLPPDFFEGDGKNQCVVAMNYELSEQDKAGIAALYPNNGETQQVVVSENLADAKIGVASSLFDIAASSEYMERLVVDLESDDTATRRNARARLSQVLARNSGTEQTNRVLEKLPAGSYRYKLGVAVALGGMPSTIKVSKAASQALSESIPKKTTSSTKEDDDKVLRINLLRAQKKIVVSS